VVQVFLLATGPEEAHTYFIYYGRAATPAAAPGPCPNGEVQAGAGGKEHNHRPEPRRRSFCKSHGTWNMLGEFEIIVPQSLLMLPKRSRIRPAGREVDLDSGIPQYRHIYLPVFLCRTCG
jgi:hypothetical protein